MADEWSKPVKGDGDTWRVTLDNGYSDGSIVIFSDGEITAEREATGYDGGTVYDAVHTTRDVVLRLLAAEASDRLGWVWEVDAGEWIASSGMSMWGRHAETGEPITYDDHFGFTSDELLASLMGRFLLADALREAGQ